MGIRIHKTVGFGTRGFVPPAGFKDRLEEACEKTSLRDFVPWCRAHQEEILAFAPEGDFRRTMLNIELQGVGDDRKLDAHLGEHIIFDGEFGFKDALLLIPPGVHLPSWKRYNDSIDWCEDTELHNQQERWVPLTDRIEPFLKGKPPLTIAAICCWLGVPELFKKLHETLYVYWS